MEVDEILWCWWFVPVEEVAMAGGAVLTLFASLVRMITIM